MDIGQQTNSKNFILQKSTNLTPRYWEGNQHRPRFSSLNQAAANYVALQSPLIKATRVQHKLLLFFMLDLVMENYEVTTNYTIKTL